EQLIKMLDRLVPVHTNPNDSTECTPISDLKNSKESLNSIDLDPRKTAIAGLVLLSGNISLVAIASRMRADQKLFFQHLKWANILLFLPLFLISARKRGARSVLNAQRTRRSELLAKTFFIVLILAGLPYCVKLTKNEFVLN